jgi:DNA-binding MarR family transcriptional regulator
MQSMEYYAARWDEDFPGTEEYIAAVELLQAERRIRARIAEILLAHDLTVAQWSILTTVYLTEGQRIAISRLAEQMGVHATTVTNAVEKLESQGLLTRVPADGRTMLAVITKDGILQLRKVQLKLAAARFGFGDMSLPQLRAVTAALRRIPQDLPE